MAARENTAGGPLLCRGERPSTGEGRLPERGRRARRGPGASHMPRKKKVAGEEQGQPMATEHGAAASTEAEEAAGESVESPREDMWKMDEVASPREESNKPPVTITRGIVCGTIAVSLQNRGDDAEGARPARSQHPPRGPARPLRRPAVTADASRAPCQPRTSGRSTSAGRTSTTSRPSSSRSSSLYTLPSTTPCAPSSRRPSRSTRRAGESSYAHRPSSFPSPFGLSTGQKVRLKQSCAKCSCR